MQSLSSKHSLTTFLLSLFLLHFLSPSIATPSPPSYKLNLQPASRATRWADLKAEFRLVYAVNDERCPSVINLGPPTITERQIGELPMSSISEDGNVCQGSSPLSIVTEATVLRTDGLLTNVGLPGFRAALDTNRNARALAYANDTSNMLLGWHGEQRVCGEAVYDKNTVYFFIKEEGGYTITLRKPGSSTDLVQLPVLQTAVFIVDTSNRFCLLTDKSSNAEQDVTLTTTYTNGTQTKFALTASGRVPLPQTSTSQSTDPFPSPSASASADLVSAVPPPADTSGTPSESVLPTPTFSPADSTLPSSSPTASLSVGASPSLSASASPIIAVTELASPDAQSGDGQTSGATGDGMEASPTAAESTSASACFPASASVTLVDGSVVKMHELQIGHVVRTPDGMSRVVLFTHRRATGTFAFVQLTVQTGHSVRLTDGHYIAVRRHGSRTELRTAGSVRVGDVVLVHGAGWTRVQRVEMVRDEGLFNPQTESGSLMVDGVGTSCYTTAVHPQMAHGLVKWVGRMLPESMRRMVSDVFVDGSVMQRWLPDGAEMMPLIS